MLLLPVAFCTPIHKHGCDLNIEGGEGANVILCYNICDRDCSLYKREYHLSSFGLATVNSGVLTGVKIYSGFR